MSRKRQSFTTRYATDCYSGGGGKSSNCPSTTMTSKKMVLGGILAFFIALFGIMFAFVFSVSESKQTLLTSNQAATAPTDPTGFWTDAGRRGESFGGGSGSAQDPYLITCEKDLAYLSYMMYSGNAPKTTAMFGSHYYENYYFKQTADLDLSAYYWQPIGIKYDRTGSSKNYCFSGNYDGGGFTISGVFTPAGNTSAFSCQGLFGYAYKASTNAKSTIKNINLVDSYIQGYADTGAIVGYGLCEIINCSSSATIVASNSGIGGILGNGDYYGSGCVIRNCVNLGDISGVGTVGGIVGYASYPKITNCYNTGTINGSESGSGNYVGGIIGNSYNAITISNCFNLGSVSKLSIGMIGAIVGRDRNSKEILNNYYGGVCDQTLGGINGTDVSGQATYLNDIETLAKTKEWFEGASYWNSSYPWDFVITWEIQEGVNEGLPILKFMDWWLADEDYYNVVWQGEGTEENPYLISSAEDLALLSYMVYYGKGPVADSYSYSYYPNVYFKQTRNIDLSAHYWQPIGISSGRDNENINHYFSGKYDGGGFTISGMFTPAGSSSAYSYQGLFGIICGEDDFVAEIKNVNIVDSLIQGASCVGAIVGGTNGNGENIISNCSNDSVVSGNDSSVGGIAGSAGKVINCYNSGEISNISWSVGGIAGSGYDVYNCYNTGVVTGVNNVGGIVGSGAAQNCYNSGSIFGTGDGVSGIVGNGHDVYNCYNTGSVEGANYVGGLLGSIGISSSMSTIKNSYNAGSISGTGNYVGGLAGECVTILFSYNKGAVSGLDYVGGIAGKIRSILVNTVNLGTVVATGSNVGGIAGTNGNILYSYYGDNCEQIGAVAGEDFEGASYLENLNSFATSQDWYENSLYWIKTWDFQVTWEINLDENDGYPILTGESNVSSWISDPSYYNVQSKWEGSGTEEDPYLISSAEDLAGLSYMISSGTLEYVQNPTMGAYCYYSGVYFKQTKDIDLSAHDWYPIGGAAGEVMAFAGVYDGDGHIISGISLIGGGSESDMAQALFGAVCGKDENTPAVIKNLVVSDSLILTFGGMAAGIVSYALEAIIDNCFNITTVMGSGYVSGIVSVGANVTISNCNNYGEMKVFEGFISGIVCMGLYSLNIENCNNFGALTGNAEGVGGILGMYNEPSGQCFVNIKNCINFGHINVSTQIAGGITSYVGASKSETRSLDFYIENCVNFGEITLTSEQGMAGGIAGALFVGSSEAQFVMNNCYSNCNFNINGSAFVGGLFGQVGGDYSTYTSAQVYNCAADILINLVEGEILGQGALYVEMDGVALPITNSYGLIDGELTITDETSGMDGNFAYLENFNGGKPVPIGIYYILDYGITTGIVDQINSLQI